MNPIKLFFLRRKVRREVVDGFEMIGSCACGGTLVRNPWRRTDWMCSRSHWWNRGRHVYVKGEVDVRVRKP